MSGTPDLSKLVQLIMENPELVESISKLMASNENPSDSAPAEPEIMPPEQTVQKPPEAPVMAEPQGKRERRTRLLTALKPYMSGERARAIDSMISIVDVLDIMKTR
jgi:hypothetical protein